MNAPVVVIGSGADALVCAHVLARAGHTVTVVREHDAHGDAFHIGWVPPQIARDLTLERAGLTVHAPDPWLSVALPAGGRLDLTRDVVRTAAAIRPLSAKDADRWPAFCERMQTIAGVLEALYLDAPPDPLAEDFGGLVQLARTGLRARRLGRQGLYDLLRILPMPIADLLDDWFESDVLKGALGALGVAHLCQGPRSAGTAFNFLHHHVGSPAGVFRPPHSNVQGVLRGLPGVAIREARAERIDVRAGAAHGVVLEDGERIDAALVVSGASPERTLLELTDPAWLDPELTRAVRNIRSRGVVAEVTLTLDRDPGFTTLAVAPSLDYLERAYDDVKYARTSGEPYIEARHVAPAGEERHRLHVYVQFVPHAPADGPWDTERSNRLARLAVERLCAHVPGLESLVVDRHVLTPSDLEHGRGYPQGQAYHAEIALDQMLWMRPVPALARYRTPIAGLYLCGPAMHPGGGIAGAGGANAGRTILRDLKTVPRG